MALAMASLQSQHNPGIEQDNMEISSDAGHPTGDDDILIDIDVDDPNRPLPDEDLMDDDDPGGPQDDIMFDEASEDETHEETMEDNPDYDDQDEELQDAVDETHAVEDPGVLNGSSDHRSDLTQDDELPQDNQLLNEADVTYVIEDVQPGDQADHAVAEETEDTQYFEANSALEGSNEEQKPAPGGSPDQASQVSALAQYHEHILRDGTFDGVHAETSEAVDLESIPLSQITPAENQATHRDEIFASTRTADEGPFQSDPAQQALADLHPITVVWGDAEISLFPKDSYSQYFLQDASVALKPLSEFLSACRAVLIEDLNDETDLEADFVPLDLRISETSPDSTTSCLKDILDLYVHLCDNDGINHSDPLRIVLDAKPSFTSRLSVLFDAVTQGHGLSHISEFDSGDDEPNDDSASAQDEARDSASEPTEAGPETTRDEAPQEHWDDQDNIVDGDTDPDSFAGERHMPMASDQAPVQAKDEEVDVEALFKEGSDRSHIADGTSTELSSLRESIQPSSLEPSGQSIDQAAEHTVQHEHLEIQVAYGDDITLVKDSHEDNEDIDNLEDQSYADDGRGEQEAGAGLLINVNHEKEASNWAQETIQDGNGSELGEEAENEGSATEPQVDESHVQLWIDCEPNEHNGDTDVDHREANPLRSPEEEEGGDFQPEDSGDDLYDGLFREDEDDEDSDEVTIATADGAADNSETQSSLSLTGNPSSQSNDAAVGTSTSTNGASQSRKRSLSTHEDGEPPASNETKKSRSS